MEQQPQLLGGCKVTKTLTYYGVWGKRMDAWVHIFPSKVQVGLCVSDRSLIRELVVTEAGGHAR